MDRRERLIAVFEDTQAYYTENRRLADAVQRGMRREGLFREFISFIKNPDGTPLYENTYQFAILRKEWRDSVSKEREAK